MRYLTIALFILSIFGSAGILKSQDITPYPVNQEKQNAWIGQTCQWLKALQPDTTLKIVKLKVTERDGKKLQDYRVIKEGLIRFEGDEWAYITMHSGHDQDSIGDISLGIDQKGNLYRQDGHVCGDIVHYTAESDEIYKTSGEFFRYFINDDDSTGWAPFKCPKRGGLRE